MAKSKPSKAAKREAAEERAEPKGKHGVREEKSEKKGLTLAPFTQEKPMTPRLALITFLDAPYPDNTLPMPQPRPPWAGGPGGPGSGQPPYPDNTLPLFPFHPIVVPPGGAWPGQPARPPYPDAGLPPFPTHLPVVPPGGAWPGQPPTQPPPTGPVYPMPPAVGVPIELVAVFVPGVGFVVIPKSALPPETTTPPPVDPNAPVINPL